MNSETARAIVQSGLDRRKEGRQEAAREARLEAYERDMLSQISGNCAAAKALRRHEEANAANQRMLDARRAARKIELMQELAKEDATSEAVNKYVVFCVVMLLLTTVTELPIWAAITLILGFAFFLACYIYRVWCPLEE